MTVKLAIRGRRAREVRAVTINTQRMTKRELEAGRQEFPEEAYWRPILRSDCELVERPCPFVSCVHHLYLDVTSNGSIKLNFPDIEPNEMGESCCLDVAERDGATLEEVGQIMNMTRERVRQVEERVLIRLRVLMPRDEGKRVAVRGHQHRTVDP